MAETQYHILRFAGNIPVWEFFDGNRLLPGDPPGKRPKGPVLALLPDRYFFYHLPAVEVGGSEKAMRQAASFQMENLFPQPLEGQEQTLLKLPTGELLGFFSLPELPELWDEHAALLERADAVTSGFMLAANAAGEKGLDSWIYDSGAEARAVYDRGRLHYFVAGAEELSARLNHMDLDTPPPEIDQEEALGILSQARVRPAKLRLPLSGLTGEEEEDTRAWKRVILAVCIIGLFFCAGEAVRWSNAKAKARALEQSVHETYVRALGPDLGNDPYGKLIYELDQKRGGQVRGIDVLGFLALLSRAAPESFFVESFSLSGDAGSIRGRISDYGKLEAMMTELEQAQGFSFTLEQATSTDQGISFTIRVDVL